MLNAQGKLEIFEDFRIDYRLPKYTKKAKKKSETTGSKMQFSALEEMTESDGDMSSEEGDFSRNVIMSNPSFSLTAGGSLAVKLKAQSRWDTGKKTWFQKLRSWFGPRQDVTTEPAEPPPTITIEDFFKSVKNSVEELKVVKERTAGYEAALLKARKTGQQALEERLTEGLLAVRSETQLVASGYVKYLTEEKLVEFVKKCPKGLRLDWVINFTRVIPDALVEIKVGLDGKFIFDNYVVLHYDPGAKSWAETAEEIRKRKDPILFGVIKGRRNLYYVGDWVDELCDLTLDQVADIIGKDSISTISEKAI